MLRGLLIFAGGVITGAVGCAFLAGYEAGNSAKPVVANSETENTENCAEYEDDSENFQDITAEA